MNLCNTYARHVNNIDLLSIKMHIQKNALICVTNEKIECESCQVCLFDRCVFTFVGGT